MNGRYGKFHATRPCLRGGEFVGHGETPSEAFRDLESYSGSRSFNAGKATGAPRCFGPDGEEYVKGRRKGNSAEEVEGWLVTFEARRWGVPPKDGKPGRHFAEVIVRSERDT